jgi:hypothetical protein
MVQVVNGVLRRFDQDNRFFLTSAARADLSPCLIHFSPRVLVRNFTGDDFIKKAMGIKNGEEFQEKVEGVLKQNGLHFEIEISTSGASQWLSTAGRLRLRFEKDVSVNDATLVTDFPKFFANMVGVDGRNNGATDAKIDSSASYQPIVTKLIPDAVVQKMP